MTLDDNAHLHPDSKTSAEPARQTPSGEISPLPGASENSNAVEPLCSNEFLISPAHPNSQQQVSIAPGYLGPIDANLPEDLRVPWGWFDLFLLIIIAVAGTFLASIFIVICFAGAGISFHQIQSSPSEKNLVLIFSQAALSFLLLAYLAAQMHLGFRLPFWRTVGWRPLQTGNTPRPVAYLGLIIGGFLLAILVSLASAALNTKTKMPIEQFFQDRRSALLLMALGILLAPLLEETIFRGYIYPVVARSYGVLASILFTGTLFGLMHASQLWGAWGNIALLVVVGIIFTAARAATRTVLTSYLLHVSYNSFLFLAFFIQSHGFTQFPVGQ
jgi:membrane protease YdiL (CAAX protease family)